MKSIRGQMKVQQMAFVLVAIVIFFVLVGLLFFSVGFRSLEESALELRESEAKEIVRKFAGSAEFTWEECANCVDWDKLLVLKDRASYDGFWNFDYLAIEVVHPDRGEEECASDNYPDCGVISIIEAPEDFGTVETAFVSLCRWDPEGYTKCELGKIIVSARGIG